MKRVIKDIENKKDLEINLPRYASGMMSLYNRFAAVRLAMNYYSYYEVISERNSDKYKKVQELLERVNRIIENVLLERKVGPELEDAVGEVESIRYDIIQTMQVLTSFTDVFHIYEYVLNRIEHKFYPSELPAGYEDGQFTRQIMQYIVSDEDRMAMNMKICEIIGQLPVRMTKERFFELVDAGLSLYEGSEKGSVDDFLYMLRTSAMLDFPEERANEFPELNEIYQEIQNTVFSDISKEQYQNLHDKILFVSEYIADIVDMYVMLTELVNDIYAILLSSPYAMADMEEVQTCHAIISAVNGKFQEESLDPLGDEVCDMLIALEGKQEKIYEQYTSYEFLMDKIKSEYGSLLQSLMLEKQYQSLYRIADLLSGSGLFMEFKEQPEKMEKADEEYIVEKQKKLRDDFMKLFENNCRSVNRGVMSAVLSSLPVFFENITELQDYVYNSLNRCQDEAEKLAVYEVIHQIITDVE